MKNILIFLAGSAVGAVISAKLIEKYYREMADEEIESVVEYFKNKEKELEEKYSEKNKVENKPKNKKKDKVNADEIIKKEEYIPEEEIEKKPIDSIVGFEIIDPMDFANEDGYDTKSWMLWADDVLTNEFDEIVEEPSEFIGDALLHFGDYGEEDSVYVRNHANKIDYEILKSEKEFNA